MSATSAELNMDIAASLTSAAQKNNQLGYVASILITMETAPNVAMTLIMEISSDGTNWVETGIKKTLITTHTKFSPIVPATNESGVDATERTVFYVSEAWYWRLKASVASTGVFRASVVFVSP